MYLYIRIFIETLSNDYDALITLLFLQQNTLRHIHTANDVVLKQHSSARPSHKHCVTAQCVAAQCVTALCHSIVTAYVNKQFTRVALFLYFNKIFFHLFYRFERHKRRRDNVSDNSIKATYNYNHAKNYNRLR